MTFRSARRTVIVLTFLSLALGLAHLKAIRNAPQFLVPVVDEAAYDGYATGILEGTWPDKKVFYQDPLYPYFLALIYRNAGHRTAVVKIIQVFLGALTIPLIFGIGRRAFGTTTGVVSAVLMVLYRPLYFFEGVMDKEIFCLLLLCISLFSLMRIEDDKKPYRWVIPGFTLGLACLTRANLLLMIPVWGAWILVSFGRRFGYKRSFGAAAIFVITAFATISPVTVHNIRAGDFVLITSQGGQNFYIGNQSGNISGTYQGPPFVKPNPIYEESDFRIEAERLAGRKMKPSQVSNFWYLMAFKEIKESPKLFLRLLWRKMELMVNDYEISDNVNYYLFRERYSWILRMPTPGWGFMAALAVWGGIALLRRKGAGGGVTPSGGTPMLLLAVVYSASLVAFYIFARYRLPALAAYAPFAAFGLKTLWEFMAKRKARYFIGGLLAVIALNVWTHRTIMKPHFDVAYYQTGNCLIKLGRYEEAEKELREATILEPTVAAYHTNLAGVLYIMGKNREAAEEYRDALRIEPRSPTANIGLGNAYSALKMYEDAAMHYQIGILFGGESSPAWTNLGRAYLELGRTVDSAAAFGKALELDPKNSEARKLMERIGQLGKQ